MFMQSFKVSELLVLSDLHRNSNIYAEYAMVFLQEKEEAQRVRDETAMLIQEQVCIFKRNTYAVIYLFTPSNSPSIFEARAGRAQRTFFANSHGRAEKYRTATSQCRGGYEIFICSDKFVIHSFCLDFIDFCF